MTIAQAAAIAGVSLKTGYDGVHCGELYAVQKDGALTVTPEAVRAWHGILMKRGRSKCRTADELERMLRTYEVCGGG